MKLRFSIPLIAFLAIVLFGAGTSLAEKSAGDDKHLHSLIEKFRLTGDPLNGRDLPSIHDEKSQLGKKLFFSKTLSGGRDVSCASCHHPTLGGGDGLSLSRGANTIDPDVVGPGRLLKDEDKEGPTVPRNALTTFNTGMLDSTLLWDGAIRALMPIKGKNGANPLGIATLDSRLNTPDKNAGKNLLTAVARFPVVFDVEMRGLGHLDIIEKSDKRQALWAKRNKIRQMLADRLAESEYWRNDFENVFGSSKIDYEKVGEGIASYIRSQNFVDNSWKKYVQGDLNSLSDSAKRGAKLFFDSPKNGGALCVRCHMGDTFTDERFHVIGTPQLGRGKADGDDGEEDFGRFRESTKPIDKYAFRTPSLLNVTQTGPWGRTGAFLSLEGIIRHHFGIEDSLRSFDYSKLESSIRRSPKKGEIESVLAALENRKAKGLAVPVQREVSDDEVGDLVSFLKSLEDPCVTSSKCLSPWMPDGSEPEELNLLKAKDPSGILLREK